MIVSAGEPGRRAYVIVSCAISFVRMPRGAPYHPIWVW
jgi:hypothetical protein